MRMAAGNPYSPRMSNAVAVLYATWHGQAEKVARHIGDVAFMHGVHARVENVRALPAVFALDDYAGVIFVGSVHFGRHPGALTNFARHHRTTLMRSSTAFVSVSGAAMSLHGEDEAQGYINKFVMNTGWQPDVTLSVAGAIPYTRYDFVTRGLMRFASRIAGRESDASRDYEYTNWFTVDHFVQEFLGEVGLGKPQSAAR